MFKPEKTADDLQRDLSNDVYICRLLCFKIICKNSALVCMKLATCIQTKGRQSKKLHILILRKNRSCGGD